MHPVPLATALLLLLVANGTPVVAAKVLGSRFAWPLDRGHRLADGRPLFGHSKTWRGLLLAIAATAAAAPCVGLDWRWGAAIGAAAMAGDLLSSFLKRRLGVVPSGMLPGVDQVPESLLPLLLCRGALSLSAADTAAGVVIFFVGEVLLSRLLFRLHLRDRPY
jgi:hypothetical protein